MSNYKAEIKKDLEKTSKIAYKMVDISQKLKLTPRAIRYSDSVGLLGEVKRSIGYTRYFSDADMHRLKEIKTLKKKGLKISEIKTLFKEKYPLKTQSITHQISIDSPFIEPDDIILCRELGMTITNATIIINGVSLDYMNWRSVAKSSFIDPFNIEFESKGVAQIWDFSNSWVGNGMRCIINAALHQQLDIGLTSENITRYLGQTIEWLIMPVTIHATGVLEPSLSDYFLIEKRSNGQTERHILPISEAVILVQKQCKQTILDVNGRVKHVTLHRSNTHKAAKRIEKCIKALALNKDRLSIEELSPIYMQKIQSNDVILLAMLR